MFGINDDDKQAKPADDASAPVADSPPADGNDSPMMPMPQVTNDQPVASPAVNPISGVETLGPPQISSALPPIITGSGDTSRVSTDKKKELLTTLAPAPADNPPPAAEPEKPAEPSTPPSTADGPDTDNLLSIKKEALQNLTPLVDQLEQDPPEKFKTLMMLLQASDNADLVKDVYDAANQIPDEKVKAQALLDVVNEINYFTQPKST